MSPEATIELPPLAPPVDELWHVLLDLADTLPVPWTLVGGQMVLLHALEHGQVPPEVSQDGDLLADVRGDKQSLKVIVAALCTAGFRPEPAGDNLVHRYTRESNAPRKQVTIDLLAPEGVGKNANLTTTPPARTVEAPGGTQAITRTEHVMVVHEDRQGRIPRPTLLASIVIKAAAVNLPGNPARHLRDLALLCALLDDPFAAAEELTSKDRQRVRIAQRLEENDHPAWSLVPETIRTNGQIAYAVLAGRT
jgi:hypothetical protein